MNLVNHRTSTSGTPAASLLPRAVNAGGANRFKQIVKLGTSGRPRAVGRYQPLHIPRPRNACQRYWQNAKSKRHEASGRINTLLRGFQNVRAQELPNVRAQELQDALRAKARHTLDSPQDVLKRELKTVPKECLKALNKAFPRESSLAGTDVNVGRAVRDEVRRRATEDVSLMLEAVKRGNSKPELSSELPDMQEALTACYTELGVPEDEAGDVAWKLLLKTAPKYFSSKKVAEAFGGAELDWVEKARIYGWMKADETGSFESLRDPVKHVLLEEVGTRAKALEESWETLSGLLRAGWQEDTAGKVADAAGKMADAGMQNAATALARTLSDFVSLARELSEHSRNAKSMYQSVKAQIRDGGIDTFTSMLGRRLPCGEPVETELAEFTRELDLQDVVTASQDPAPGGAHSAANGGNGNSWGSVLHLD